LKQSKKNAGKWDEDVESSGFNLTMLASFIIYYFIIYDLPFYRKALRMFTPAFDERYHLLFYLFTPEASGTIYRKDVSSSVVAVPGNREKQSVADNHPLLRRRFDRKDARTRRTPSRRDPCCEAS
jgi:hypothetical protein